MASFSDDFNRANGSLGSNWSNVTSFSAMQISSNAANAGSVAKCMAAVNTSTVTFANDHSAQITVGNIGSFDYVGLLVRVSGGTGYGVQIDGRTGNSNNTLFRFAGGVITSNLGTGSLTATAGDTLKLVASGTTIALYKNGSLVDSVTDATYASGQPGILSDFGNSNVGIVDDFVGLDITASAAFLGINNGMIY